MPKRIKGFTFVGQIKITAGISVSDPCYDFHSYGNFNISNIEKGIYNCYVARRKHDKLVKSLFIIKDDETISTRLPDEFLGVVGVDAGVCGFFDSEYFANINANSQIKDDWYQKYVVDTIGMDNFICDESGIFSTSGCGDGCYPVYGRGNSNGNYESLLINYL